MSLKFVGLAFCAFLGGIAGSLCLSATQSYAAKKEEKFYTTNFFNDQGQRIAVIGNQSSGEGTFFLFNSRGKPEIQMGAYGEGSEREQTLIGMHDPNGYLRLLMRMHGPKDSPTIIMKDHAGMDRIVFGLDPQTQEPYFLYRDKSGKDKHLIPR